MKKVFYLLSTLIFLTSCTKISSQDKQKADLLYKSTLPYECFTDSSESEKALYNLNQAINLDRTEWNYYLQKIKIYKYRLNKSEDTEEKNEILNNIISVYKDWKKNGNKMDSSKNFGLGCSYIAYGKSEIGIDLLSECYKGLENDFIKEIDEQTFLENVVSGIIIGKINKDNVEQVLIFEDNEIYNDFIVQEVNNSDSLNLSFKYAGGF